MNAIFKDAFEQIERLSPEAQKTLAAEIEKRAYELWLDAELEKGIKSLDEEGGIPADEAFARLRSRIQSTHGA